MPTILEVRVLRCVGRGMIPGWQHNVRGTSSLLNPTAPFKVLCGAEQRVGAPTVIIASADVNFGNATEADVR
jgi:hypothetical protein